MSEQHKFRYLLPPGNNFHFVSKFKAWIIASILLMAAAVGMLFINKSVRGDYMNWTIDFKGGTEIVVAFKDKATNKYISADPHKVRQSLEKAGEEIEVSERTWEDENNQRIEGMVVRTPKFSAIADDVKEKARVDFITKFGDNERDKARPDSRKITRASWSGDRFNVKSLVAITNAEVTTFFETVQNNGKKLEVKPWLEAETEQAKTPDAGTKEFNQWYGIWGVDRQVQLELENTLGNQTNVLVVQSYGVGAKAGDKLRDDAAKAIIYAIFLIMLYLSFRFDIRYAPGAAFATVHDAVMVIGVFALTWTEVSLTSVAGLLTVMGFSVNDTVIVFDRIRENQAKLKDKSIERIIDISINEMLVRTILTSSTVFATTLIMNIFGTGLVKNFAFAMNIGVLVGTYSSIFLATPIFMWISKK
ncbi:MAG: protein translocase subunit SecF, partial [Kofleriaceae bacterium]